jgi:hypothetical protein
MHLLPHRQCLAHRVGAWFSPAGDREGHAREVGVRVRGHVTVRVSLCLSAVWSRACVDTWVGAVSCDSLKTVAPVTVCCFGLRLGGARVDHGDAPDNAHSQGVQELNSSAGDC